MGDPEDLAVRTRTEHLLLGRALIPRTGRRGLPVERRVPFHDGFRDPRRRWLLHHLVPLRHDRTD